MIANKKNIKAYFKQEDGFTLLEILLSVAIFGFIALGLVRMSQEYVQEKRSVVAAEHMKMIHNAAYRYVMDNFENIYLSQLGGNGGTGSTLFVPVDNDGTSLHYIKRDPDLLPVNFSPRNPFGQTVAVLLRNAGNRNIEIVCISTGRPAPEAQVEAAAITLGGYGGFWSAIDRDTSGGASTADSVIGAFGMWAVPVVGLSSPSWPGADFPTLGEGAYLASYQWINYTNEIGDYLYRVALPLAPEANAMMTNINMNNYNIDGADDVDIVGNLDVNTSAAFRGSARIQGTTTIAKDLVVSSDVDSNQAYVEKLNSTVNGSIDTSTAINAENFTRDANNVDGMDIIVGSAINASGTVNVDTLNTEGANASALTMPNADMLAVTLDVGQINVATGTVETNTVNNASLSTVGLTEVETLSGSDTTRVSGPSGSTAVTTTVTGDSVMRGAVSISRGFRCDVGC